jgi:hypothetical protein
MNYIQMLIKPFQSLWDNIVLVIPATFISIGLSLVNAVTTLIQVEAILVVGLVIIVFLDLISGLYKAARLNKIVSSYGLRQTGIKFAEYTLVCVAFVVLANMSSEIAFVKKVPFIFLAMVEVKSIVENLSDNKGALNGLFEHIKSLMENRKP